jgi:hypothetical protein
VQGVPGRLDRDELATYLQDHLAGSAGGLSLANRLADEEEGTKAEAMAQIARDIEEDRQALVSLMESFDVSPSRVKQVGGWLTEILGRVKLNPHVSGGPMLRYEGLIMGVTGKLQLWRGLLEVAPLDRRLVPEELTTLARRAEDQRRRLEKLHAETARAALAA